MSAASASGAATRTRPVALPVAVLAILLMPLLGAFPGASALHAQPRVIEVVPASLELEAGGRVQTIRLTAQGLTEISGVRFLQGRLPVSGFQATPRRTAIRTLRSGTTATFEVELSAASSVAVGTYAVQILSGRTAVAVPLQLRVVPLPFTTRTGTVRVGAAQPGAVQPVRPVAEIDSRLNPGRLALQVGCRGSATFPEPNQATDLGEIVFSQESGPLVVEVCATEGFAEYAWTLEGVSHLPDAGETYRSVSGTGEQVAPHRFVVTIPTPQKRQRVRVRVEAKPPLASLPSQGGRLWLSPTLPNLVIVATPSFQGYWVENIRPGASGRLENDGIFDPELTGDASDGVFWVQGTNLVAPDLRVGVSTGYGTHWATILERTRSGSSDVLKARLRDFRTGRLTLRHSGGSTQSPRQVRRLGYWPFPTPELSVLVAQGVRCSLGSPRGQATLVLPNRTLNFRIDPMEGFGFQVEVLDMNSSAVSIQAEPGGEAGREVILTTRIDFETSGREFEGSFLPTISWWECGTFRVETSQCASLDLACFGEVIGSALLSSISCMNPGNWEQRTGPGPAVPVAGDLTSPRAIFRTTLRIDASSGALVARGLDASFEADINLQSGVGTIPLGALKHLVLARTNEDLGELAREADFGGEIARLVNGIAQGFGVGRLRHIERLPDGRIYMEHEP